jgi:hypothetical protein
MNWSSIALCRTGLIIRNHEHLIILTILTLSVILMLLLQFTSACLPAEIGLVNRRNK